MDMSLEDRGASTERLTHYHCWGIFFLLFFLSGPRVFAAEQQLGTMFYSPAERRALVAARTGVDDGKKVGEEFDFIGGSKKIKVKILEIR